MELLSVKLIERTDFFPEMMTVALNDCVLVYWNPEKSNDIGMEYDPEMISEEDASKITKEFFLELKQEIENN
jgi:hypothetical protein